MNDFKLMSEEQRNKLRQAYSFIESVVKEMDYSYDDITPADTSLYYLDRAINYKKKNS